MSGYEWNSGYSKKHRRHRKNNYSRNNYNNYNSYNNNSNNNNMDFPEHCASVTILNNGRFSICSEYSKQLLSFIHMIPYRQWHQNAKVWTFPMSQYNVVISQLQAFGMTLFDLPSNLTDQMVLTEPVTELNDCDNVQKKFSEEDEDLEFSSFLENLDSIDKAVEPQSSSPELPAVCLRCALSDAGANTDDHECQLVDLCNIETVKPNENGIKCDELLKDNSEDVEVDEFQKSFYETSNDDDLIANINLDLG